MTLIFWGAQALLIASCVLGIVTLIAQQRALGAVVHTHEVKAQLERVLNRLVDAEAGQRGYLLASAPEYLDPYRDAIAVIEREIAAVAALTSDNPVQQAAIRPLREKIDARLELLARGLRLYERGDEEGALAVVRSGEGLRLMQEIRADLAKMDAVEGRLLVERTQRARRYGPAGWVALMTLAGLTLGLVWQLRRTAVRERERIAASERHLATTIASIADGVITTDARAGVLGMNPVAERLTGYEAHEARGKPLEAICPLVADGSNHPLESPARVVLQTRKVFDHPTPVQVRPRSGETRTVEVTAAPMDRSGALEGVVLVLRDVTERDRAALALRKSEARFRQVLEALPQLVWTCSGDGKNTFVSRQWLQYTGTTLGENLGHGWGEALHPDDRARVSGEWQRSVDTGMTFNVEARLRGPDGIYRWFKQLAVPIRNEKGTIDEWFGTSTEITDIIEARESVRRTNAQLEARVEARTHELRQANADLQAFAHSVAHDLRAPLRNLQGYASAIIEDEGPRLSDEGALYARRMAESAGRLDGLIQDLLAYSRLSRTEIVPEVVGLQTVVEHVLRDLSNEISLREAVLTVQPDLPSVLAHRPTLTQVVTNLVANALKFVSPDATPVVAITAEGSGPVVRLIVADNGIGIPAEHHERIFRVFERLHGSETYPGTGIGLAIVRRGVERMGGRVVVESRAGAGAKFIVELPSAEHP